MFILVDIHRCGKMNFVNNQNFIGRKAKLMLVYFIAPHPCVYTSRVELAHSC